MRRNIILFFLLGWAAISGFAMILYLFHSHWMDIKAPLLWGMAIFSGASFFVFIGVGVWKNIRGHGTHPHIDGTLSTDFMLPLATKWGLR